MNGMAAEAPELFPASPEQDLRAMYVGKDLKDVDGPAAVIDLAIVKRHCKTMLDTAAGLDVGFRAHVKTHKTTQLARLQVGEGQGPVKLIVSTVAEAQQLRPFLAECKRNGRHVNVLYGVPPSSTCYARLASLLAELGDQSISFLIDHPSQLLSLERQRGAGGQPIPVFVKVDTGHSRAGVKARSQGFNAVIEAILKAQARSGENPTVKLVGLYCHQGDSYGGSSPEDALNYLAQEVEGLLEAASFVTNKMASDGTRLTLSVGATPTASSAQNLFAADAGRDPATARVRELLRIAQVKHDIELHAGVYPLLDLQQLATHARPVKSPDTPTMSTSDIGVRVLAEVLSVYPERKRPEALIGAGCLALGREPCKSYSGWAVVSPSPWAGDRGDQHVFTEDDRTGWIVGRISQEHGILTWEGPIEKLQEMTVGQKVLLWPNHACIASAGFGWYLVVDSGAGAADATKIVDVWSRWRGW